MTRKELIERLYGELTPSQESDLICEMGREMDSFVAMLAATIGVPKYEGRYFFFGRMGSNYGQYMFNWEPFRDFAGPLLRSPTSIPVVLVSSDDKPLKPIPELITAPRPHYEIAVSPKCSALDIATTWLEVLSDDGAIPREGGEKWYGWFFSGLGFARTQLSKKARNFVNMFASSR